MILLHLLILIYFFSILEYNYSTNSSLHWKILPFLSFQVSQTIDYGHIIQIHEKANLCISSYQACNIFLKVARLVPCKFSLLITKCKHLVATLYCNKRLSTFSTSHLHIGHKKGPWYPYHTNLSPVRMWPLHANQVNALTFGRWYLFYNNLFGSCSSISVAFTNLYLTLTK